MCKGLKWPLLLVAALLPSRAIAEGEFRLKLDADYMVWQSEEHPFMNVRPMLRLEQRLRAKGLVMEKVFAGLRADLLPWLTVQTYYSHKDNFYKEHEIWHLAVFDIIFRVKLGPVTISDRNGNEMHSKPKFGYYFYRYRNYLDFHFDVGLSWLRPFVGDEIRFDKDQGRINLNDAIAGLEFIIDKHLRVQAFYDLESNRRSKPTWVNTHVFQLFFLVRL